MPEPQLHVFPDLGALSRAAAERFAVLASEAVAARGRFLVVLSGGGTPQGLYELLGRPPYRTEIPWPETQLFWGDERLVLPDDPGSSFGQVDRALLRFIAIPTGNVHRAKGEAEPGEAVRDYRAQLREAAGKGRKWPRFDLVLLGMGSDGHTASLFPGPISLPEQMEPVIAVTAEYEDRPARRITLTPNVFNDARCVLFLVAGAGKARTLSEVLRGPYRPELWPAQRIRPAQGELIWFADEAAASMLE